MAPRTVPFAIGGIRVSNPYGLGALDPAAAAEQIFPATKITRTAGHTQAVHDQIVAAAQSGQMSPQYLPGTVNCSATGQSSNVRLAQTASGLALTGINVAAAMSSSFAAAIGGAAVLGPLTLGVGALIGLFPLFFGHHAAAVKKEQSVLCAAVPAANNYLQVIDQAVQQGLQTPQQAIAALDSLLSDFRSQVGSILKGSGPASSGACNAACVMLAELQAIVAVKKSQYQDLIAAPGGEITSAVSQAAASAGVPAWLLYAAGAYLLYQLF